MIGSGVHGTYRKIRWTGKIKEMDTTFGTFILDHPAISRNLVEEGGKIEMASSFTNREIGFGWPNAGFIGEGVEKIDIGGEYGDQSEITAAARDKITPAPPIQIVYRDRSEIGFNGVPAGSSPSGSRCN